jgi:hypothetical protein
MLYSNFYGALFVRHSGLQPRIGHKNERRLIAGIFFYMKSVNYLMNQGNAGAAKCPGSEIIWKLNHAWNGILKGNNYVSKSYGSQNTGRC